MKITIRTRYQGPTDTKGSRIVAKGAGRQLSRPYDHSLNTSEMHERVASELAGRIAGVENPTAGEVSEGDVGFTYAFHYRIATVSG